PPPTTSRIVFPDHPRPRPEDLSAVNRLLVPTSALMWGLQIAFLSPSLALILSTLYGAGTTEIGWVLAIYNASGFLASLVVPAWADRRQEYLGPMLLSGVLTVLLVVLLALVTSLPLVTLRSGERWVGQAGGGG